MKKALALILALVMVFAVSVAFACNTCGNDVCTGCGSGPVKAIDVKAYGMIEATYSQSASKIHATECGTMKTVTDSCSVDLVSFGAKNEVGKCGEMGLANFQLDYEKENSVRNSFFNITQDTYAMSGAAELKNMAGVAICASAGTYGMGSVNNVQSISQNQTFQLDGYKGTQSYMGTSCVVTAAGVK